jgi:predicted RNase H-like HicB family nuclease
VTGYVIIIEGDDVGGFSSYAPDLPGIVAAAPTYDECMALTREAVAFHLEGMREDGDPIPAPTTVGVETVPAA